ncbi:C40 family peptidase [Streptomyces sp. HB2AG]|uniref:C40 family peptidase n=1 Tax=Streptomyces sp. HB2AG TaxID=2983400 RepID=UPI0022AAF8D0|nr:C40 family peptidase [Streptomyces sp. HB2AG]MCZ2524461.1 NlpC/P60 family protein [Streptomyces sp. HB2AG]
MVSHRPTVRRGPGRPGRVTGISAAAAAAAAVLAPAVTAEAAPRDEPRAVKARVDRLHEQAERAAERYNAAKEREEGLEERIDELQDEAARGQERLNRLREGLGPVATAQYRSGGIDPAVGLVLSSEPGEYLDRAATLERVAGRRAAELREAVAAQREVRQKRAEATTTLDRLDETRAQLAAHRRAVQSRLAAARRLLDRLDPAERARLGLGPGDGRSPLPDRYQEGLRTAPASGRAAAAVAAAQRAVGLPYVWGASGPSSFDCSGLMVWSYRQAGVALPRTSQGQLNAGRRIPLAEARPGDLVLYRGDASHVAMYVGGGQVVHAPRPGAAVRYDPVDMMPVTGVTRV